MTQATTTHTNTLRRAHPTAVRAALRSCVRRLIKQTDGSTSSPPTGTGSLQADNNITQFIYGDVASGLNGLLSKIIYPTLSQTLQYDQRDRITQSTDAAAGSALALDAATSQTTKNQYDAAGHQTAVTDPAARSTGTRYDALGRVNQTTDASTGSAQAPAGGLTQYGYDARGNLISVTDANGNIHRYAYDRLDRMVMEIRPLGQFQE